VKKRLHTLAESYMSCPSHSDCTAALVDVSATACPASRIVCRNGSIRWWR
jgi:hypothetical protein